MICSAKCRAAQLAVDPADMKSLDEAANEIQGVLYSAASVFQALAAAHLTDAEATAIADLSGIAMKHLAESVGEEVATKTAALCRQLTPDDNDEATEREGEDA